MPPPPRPPRSRHEFKVAILCALPLEADCVLATFDEKLDEKWTQQLGKSEHDSNAYSLGVIAGHNVVLVHMPSLGKVSAASVAAGVNSSFTCVKYAFVVGICGGVPFNGKQEVILGDVIISKVLVQYDLGKQYPDAFEAKSTIEESLTRPSQEIRSVLAKLATSQHQQRMQQEITTHIHAIQKELPGTVYPGSGSDHLYDASYLHKHRTIEGKAPCIVCESGPEHICPDASMMKCEDLGCEDSKLLQRTRLSKDNGSDINSSYGSPQLRIGRMGSADTVLKSGTHRERIASANGLIAFETEGAGMWDDFRHSLVIKGVCDYADSHKNKQWQFFAAAAAAACMKSFLGEIRLSEDTWEYEEAQRSLWYMPFDQADLQELVGRDQTLRSLYSKLSQPKKHLRAALLGLGGVGKSRLAMEVAYRARASHPKCSIFWVQATDSLSFERDYLAIGKLMQVPGLEQSGAEARRLVCRHLSHESAGEWLLILDNADDPILWAEGDSSATDTSSSLTEHLPKSRTGSILVTTRNRRVASHLAGKNVVDLDEMHIDDAEQMLRNLLEKPKILSDHENTKELLHTLTCLPLAIVQAASYLNKNDESITTYLKLLRQPEDNVIKLLSEAFNDQGRYKTALNPIATTWLVSFQQIKRENPLAARYLAFASCLSEKNIPQSLFARRSEKEMVDALGVLRGYGFFTRHDDSNVDNPVGPLYDMHRLVRLATRNWLKDQKSLTRWTARAFQRMVAAFPAAEWATRNVWMLYMPHAQMLCDSEQCQDLRERYELLYEMAVCLGWTGKDNDAVGLLKIVYRWAEPTLADDNGFKIKVCASLGDYLERLGRHVEAEGYVNRALEKSRRALGREHTVSITCMIIMGKIYKEQGCWQQAESVLKEGLEAGKKVWGPQHRDVLTANAGLAGVYMNTGQLHEVERIQVEVVELSKKYVGPEHPQTMTAMSDLSRTYREQGRLDKAEKLGLEVCEASERVLGPEHPTTFYALDKLSRVYYAQDRMKAAEEIASKCLGGMSRVLGTEHRQTMESMDLLANIWTDQARLEGAADAQDQLKGAEKMASECLENKSRVLGREHWQTLQTMELLAWIRTDQGRLEEAIELMRECVESSTQTFGTENWRTKGRSEALKEWQQQLAVQAGDANPLSATESSSRVAEEEVEEAPEKPENTLGGTESSSHQQQQHGPQAQRSQQQLEPSKRRRFLNRLVSRKKEDPSKSRE